MGETNFEDETRHSVQKSHAIDSQSHVNLWKRRALTNRTPLSESIACDFLNYSAELCMPETSKMNAFGAEFYDLTVCALYSSCSIHTPVHAASRLRGRGTPQAIGLPWHPRHAFLHGGSHPRPRRQCLPELSETDSVTG